MNKPVVNILAHVIVWLLFFALILSVTNAMSASGFMQKLVSLPFLVFCFVYLFVFYFNTFFLFPVLYLQKKLLLYFFVILGLFILVLMLTPFDNLISSGGPTRRDLGPPRNQMEPPQYERMEPPMRPPNGLPRRTGPAVDIASIIIFLMVWLASISFQLMKEWRSSQQRTLVAERDKKGAELAFLKAHINPHFLFNTLNNIYSLAIVNHGQTAVSILKLSHIMRYVTESVAIDFISLEDEVECVVDYVDLQKLRLTKKVYLDFSVTGNTQDKMIAPLILISFIENAFKYGTTNHYQSTITIKLFVEDDSVTFYCQNRIFNGGLTYNRYGIGLENTKRRLEYLYPEKHSLDIQTDKQFYTVQLILQTPS
ncbi:MAG: sensor histidine kinase [Ferruginibacter sp.]